MEREGWNQRYAGSELLWTAQPNRFLVDQVADLPPGRALDLGCGEGRNAVWLAARGWEVTGVDFSDVALAKAQRLAAHQGVSVEWVLADVREYVPQPGAFELVAVLYLHLPAAVRREVLARASAAVAPGGVMLVVGHDTTNLTEGYGGPPDPAILISPEDVAAELPDLRVERAERVLRPVATPNGNMDAVDALVRARRTVPAPDP